MVDRWHSKGDGVPMTESETQQHVGATSILLSKQLESPTFIQHLHRLTAARARESAGSAIDVVLVEGDRA
jgi:hypothetical protein